MPLHVSSTIVLIIRRSKLYYTASGIITPVGSRLVRRLRECLMMMSTECSKHVEAYKKTYYKTIFCALSWLITKITLRCMVSKT